MSKGLSKSRKAKPAPKRAAPEPKKIEVEWVARTSLKPNKQNSRKHSEAQVDQLVRSLNEFGWTRPIMCDDAGNVVAGHGMLQAATKRGDPKVPVIRLSGMSDTQRRAYMIADNKLAANSEWDIDMLTSELFMLTERGLANLTGFSDKELEELGIGIAEVSFPSLPSGDASELEQITFTLHREQAELVRRAMAKAKKSPDVASPLNDNQNGNALAVICREFVGD